jgi:hypothetical protein
MKNKCQCPETGNVSPEDEFMYSKEERTGMNHKPNECKGTNDLKLYERNGKKIWLCSCCFIPGDTEIEESK